MNKPQPHRDILASKLLIIHPWFVIFLLWMSAVGTADEEFDPGIHYLVLKSDEESETTLEADADNATPISVVEYFSYGCPACMRFEEDIAKWLPTKAEDVQFRREAVVFNPAWAILAKVYYVAVELDVVDQVHDPMFKALHEKRLTTISRSSIKQLFTEVTEVDPETFDTAWDDEEEVVLNQIVATHDFVVAKEIHRTPSIVVNGRYLVTTRSAGSRKGVFRVVDHLIKKIRDEQKTSDVIQHL